MVTRDITIINKLGLHARAAAKLVTHAGRFSAQIEIIKEDKTINAKSIMGVMMLAASCGTQLTIRTDGPDENIAMQDLVQLIENRFGESE